MVYTKDLKSFAARLVGSSPTPGTSILGLVRTYFEQNWWRAKPHRSKPQKNPEKNIGSNHILILGEEKI